MFSRTKQVLEALKKECGLEVTPISTQKCLFRVGDSNAIVRTSRMITTRRRDASGDVKYSYSIWDVNLIVRNEVFEHIYVGLFLGETLIGVAKFSADEPKKHIAILKDRLPLLPCGEFVLLRTEMVDKLDKLKTSKAPERDRRKTLYRNYIYALKDPKTRRIFFVGTSRSPEVHPRQSNNSLTRKLSRLKDSGREPVLEILQRPRDKNKRTESWWIKTLSSKGHRLLNE